MLTQNVTQLDTECGKILPKAALALAPAASIIVGSRTRTPSSSMPRFSEIDVQRDSFQIVVIQVSSRTGRRVRP
jgi:hypothetical protein